MNRYNLDKFWVGALAGVILPPLTAWILWEITFAGKFSFEVNSFLRGTVIDYVVSVFKLGCLSNLLVFLPTFYFKMNKASQGVIASTFLCFIVVLIYALFV